MKTYDTVYNFYFDTVFDGRTGDNDLDLYFNTILDGCTGNNDNYYGDIIVSNFIIVTLKPHDTIRFMICISILWLQ